MEARTWSALDRLWADYPRRLPADAWLSQHDSDVLPVVAACGLEAASGLMALRTWRVAEWLKRRKQDGEEDQARVVSL